MASVLERAASPAETRLGHTVVVVGGGNGGISVAARILRAAKGTDVAIIEPSRVHYYQPLWTLVGGGEARKERTRRSEASVIPHGATWIQDRVVEFRPDENLVLTAGGRAITYKALVVAPGIQVNWDAIPGLRDGLGKDGVCSNYSYESVDKTWQFIQSFRGGTAIFTQPDTPIKCGGAPQKIAYLADDAFRRNGVRDATNLVFATAGASLFSVEAYAKTLRQVAARKQIDLRFRSNLVALRPETKEAVFKSMETGAESVIRYDLIHVTPPQSAPDFVRHSPLAGAGGWVDVDKHTLRHSTYANVFALGDASSLPTSKTGAAIRKQSPVLVANVLAMLEGRPLAAHYDGYTACPLVTGYNRLVMAEFDYDLQPKPTFPFDQTKERRSMYLVKKHALPQLYWRGIMKGLA